MDCGESSMFKSGGFVRNTSSDIVLNDNGNLVNNAFISAKPRTIGQAFSASDLNINTGVKK